MTVAFGGDDGPTPEPDYGLPKLATEEAAEEDAAARLLRLRSLVMVKRLYFAVLLATETVDADVAPDPPGKPKLAAVTDPETLADAVDAYVKRCARVVDAEAQCARLDAMLSGMDETAGRVGRVFRRRLIRLIRDVRARGHRASRRGVQGVADAARGRAFEVAAVRQRRGDGARDRGGERATPGGL